MEGNISWNGRGLEAGAFKGEKSRSGGEERGVHAVRDRLPGGFFQRLERLAADLLEEPSQSHADDKKQYKSRLPSCDMGWCEQRR